MQNDLVSIIIRAKNEEEWIGRTLSALEAQTYKNFEIIVVDSGSTDRTVEIAKKFDCVITHYEGKFFPGKAINDGIKKSKGSFLVILSAHTVPADERWLEGLVDAIGEDNAIAGVYGRQLPLPESSPFDKRDLIITFGPEKKVQRKDSFFHNANSIIRREVWDTFPFDEEATNIEDRLWARKAQEAGYVIVYEPEARVYHHHGIHQYGNTDRLETTVKILDDEEMDNTSREEIDSRIVQSKNDSVLCVLPVSDESAKRLLEKPDHSNVSFLENVFNEVQQSALLHHVIVATANKDVIVAAEERGMTTFFYKTPGFDGSQATLEEVLEQTVAYYTENENKFPEYVMFLSPTHVFRKADLIDELIKKIVIEREDSVLTARKEYRACWALENGRFIQKDEGFLKRSEKDPLWIGYTGLGSITKTEFINAGRRLGDSVAILSVDDVLTLLDIREDADFELAKKLFSKHKETT